MSWHYLQEQEEESSAVSFAVTLASELLKLRNIHGKFFWLVKKMECCQSSQSGMMSARSEATIQSAENTSSSLEASKTSLLSPEDSHAKTLAVQEKEQESPEREADCGKSLPVSFAKYDRQECLWKTHQCSLFGGLESFSETWPRWGMMHDGECWEVATLVRNKREKESGFIPACVASDGKWHGMEKHIKNSRKKRVDQNKSAPTEKITYAYYEADIPERYFPEISEVVMNFPQGWTDLSELETHRIVTLLNSHGIFLDKIETKQKGK
jgi:hypothetical protein